MIFFWRTRRYQMLVQRRSREAAACAAASHAEGLIKPSQGFMVFAVGVD